MKLRTLAVFLVLILSLIPTAQINAQQPQDLVTLTGVLTIVWGDTPNLESTPPRITLTDEAGHRVPVEISAEAAAPFGGILNLNNRRITLQGRWTEGVNAQAGETVFEAESITLSDGGQVGALGEMTATALTGSQKWVNILCKFSNIATEPKAKSYFDGLFGDSFPGLNHYWREVSYNNINLDGTVTYGWFNLPRSQSYYQSLGNNMLDVLADDCTAVADSQVDFRDFTGINLMFNSELDGYAWGGTQIMTLDGVQRSWKMTWEPPWSYESHCAIAHEMGHSWGWPHSSGPYGDPYDSQWDVMSGWPPTSVPLHPIYGDVGVHTISYHKDLSGWIPSERIYTAEIGSSRLLTLDRLSKIPSTSGTYLMVKIPIPGSSSKFYTVETRQRDDSTYLNEYEDSLPGEAVVIHKVDEYLADKNAQVVDATNNGDPNDDGAMWLPGETFIDAANKISVQVIAATSNGYSILVSNGQAGNDFYSGASVITKIPYTRYQDTALAASQAEDPTLSCLGSKGTNSVWFRYTPSLAGMLSVNTAGSDFDTVVAVLTGAPGNFIERGCNDNGGTGDTSSLNLFVNGGTTYYIEVVGKSGGGNLAFNLNHTPCYSLSAGVTPAASGSVNVSIAPNCNGLYYTKGTTLQVIAVPNSGFSFDKWSGSLASTTNPLDLTISSNVTVIANLLPDPPVLLAPANDSLLDSLTPTFDWDNYPTATSHRLVISTYSTLASPIFNSTLAETQKTLLAPLKANTRYYWRVQSLVNGIWSKWSETRTFITPNPPLAPALLLPISSARVTGWQPAFDWADSLLPVPATGYQIQVAPTNLFNPPLWDETTTDSRFESPEALSYNSRYYWRVRAHNALNHFGAWSSPRVFYTLPQTPNLLLPPEDHAENSLRPFFDWDDALNGARSYTLQIAKDPNFTLVILNTTVKVSQYQAVRDLPRLTTLYWRVRATGSYGTGAWSPARIFTTPNPPHVPALLAPLSGSIQTTYRPTLDWKDPPADLGTYTATAGYHLQVATDSLFSNLVIEDTALTASEFIPPAELPAGKYYWRVRAYNSEAAFSNWSTIYSFLTPATVSGKVISALTGDPLQGATVMVGSTPLSATTDEQGNFTLTYVPTGTRKIIAQIDGSIALSQTLSLTAGKEYCITFVLLPSNPVSAYRFVLTWNEAGPTDLDMHLWLPATVPTHIHWANPGDLDVFPRALLHRDDRNAGGPETIQVDQLQPGGKYLLSVYKKSEDGTWKNAAAVIQVYKGDTLIATYRAPLSTSAYRWWQVLTLDGTTGAITLLNKIIPTSGAAYDAAGGTLESKP